MDILNDLKQFTYVWKITNIRFSTLSTGSFINSPEFSIPHFENTIWYLKLYPKGTEAEFENHISCFLYRGNDSGPENFEVNHKICLHSKNRQFDESNFFKKSNGWGYDKFIAHSYKFYDEIQTSLVVLFKLQLLEVSNIQNITNYFSFPLLYSAYNNTHELNKHLFRLPVKCYAHTKFAHESITIKVPLSSLTYGNITKEFITLNEPEKFPSLTLDVGKDLFNNIDVTISLKDVIKSTLIVICKLCITDEIESLMHTEEKHLFTVENQHECWCLKEKIDTSKYSTIINFTDQSNLKLNIIFSYGKEYSEIVNVQYISVPRGTLDKNSVFPNEMYRFYKEKKLCDVALKVGDKRFDVHKVVLGVASPVFAAMFSNEMTEKKTNIVDIVDLSEHIVEEMISFIYTGSLDELNFDNAQNLFVAGDKYQIYSLMKLCRNFMISNINSQNIYEILEIADSYNDKKLEKEAANFLKLNKTRLLNSEEWDQFAEKNAVFALKILKQVCLLKMHDM